MTEIDKFLNSLKGKNPREINKEIKSPEPDKLLLMSKLLPEFKNRNESIKKTFPEVLENIKKLREFYEDLEKDNIIKIERELFIVPFEDSLKESDERNSGMISFKKVKESKLSHQEAFKELNNFYHGAYCFITKGAFKRIAQNLSGRELRKEGEIIQELKGFKNGKYKELFGILIPQIKNSISHKTYFIDRKEPEITYEDENKPSLKIKINEFSKICDKVLFFQLAHDIISWEFFEEFYFDVAEKSKVVSEFLKKHNARIVRYNENEHSIYNLGKFLESNKEKW